MAKIRKAIQAVDLVVDEDSGVLAVQPEAEMDLLAADKSKKHIHAATGTAELIEGTVAFDDGAELLIIGVDTWFAFGSTQAKAEAAPPIPCGIPVTVRLAADSNDIYIDANTGGTVSIIQVK